MSKKHSAWQKSKEIIELYESGKTSSDIGLKYGTSSNTILKILRENNIEIRPSNNQRSPVWERQQEIIDMYNDRNCIAGIGWKFGTSDTTVKKILDANDIKLGSRNYSSAWNHESQIIEDYESGKTYRELINKWRITHGTIKKVLEKNEIPLRVKKETENGTTKKC